MFEDLPKAPDGKVTRGRHSEAVDAAFKVAESKGLLDPVDGALATLVRASAWALDSFEKRGLPYGPAKLLQPTVEALRELRLTPDSRQTVVDDKIAQLLSELSDGSDSGAEVSHGARSEP